MKVLNQRKQCYLTHALGIRMHAFALSVTATFPEMALVNFLSCFFRRFWTAAERWRRWSSVPVTSESTRKSNWSPWWASAARQAPVSKPDNPVDTWSAHRWGNSWFPRKFFMYNDVNCASLSRRDWALQCRARGGSRKRNNLQLHPNQSLKFTQTLVPESSDSSSTLFSN